MTGLATQNVPIPLAQGIDTKTDPKQVQIGKLLTLENGFFQTPMEIRKRYGFDALDTAIVGGSDISSSSGLFAYGDGLVQPSSSRLYSYASTFDKWYDAGPFVPLKINTLPVSLNNNNSTNQAHADSAYDSTTDLQCFTFMQSTSIYYTVFNRGTGKCVVAPTLVATSGTSGSNHTCKVVCFSNRFLFFYLKSTSTLAYNSVSTTAPQTLLGEVTVSANQNTTTQRFDLAVIGSRLFVGFNYVTTGAAFLYLNSAFTISSELVNSTYAATNTIAIWGDDSSNMWAAYSNGTHTYGVVYDNSLTATPVSALVQIYSGAPSQIVGAASGTSSTVLYCGYTNASTTNVVYQNSFTIGAGAPTDASIWQRSLSINSKIFTYGGNFYVLLLYGGNIGSTNPQPTIFVYQVNTDAGSALIGKIAAGNAYEAPASPTTSARPIMTHVVSLSSGVFQVAFLQYAGANEIGQYGSTWCALLDFNAAPISAEIANTLHITGGQLWMFDGVSCVEHGFHLTPDSLSAIQAGSGVLTANSQYQYVAVFEWVDAQGQTHRSAPCLPLTITTGGTGAATVTVTISTLRATLKRNTLNPVRVALYRTLADGSVFYYVGFTANDTAADTITVVDALDDTTLQTGIQLYTTGGQVENSSAPPCTSIATYRSRLIVVPSDEPYSWWFSQEVIPKSASTSATPVELSEFFIKNIDQTGGPLQGVATMDDKLIFLKKDLLYYTVGNGPSPNGSNDDYTAPQVIVSPVGTVNPSSIVLTPMGIMFQSANDGGIWLLDRSLTSSYVGSEVEYYNSQAITSAVLYPSYNQVRLTTDGGVALVFDYYVKQWSVYTGISAVQACLFNGVWSWAKSDGVVYKENSSTFTDNGTFVQLKVGTSWMKFAGLQGFQRIYEVQILGEYESAHTLVAKVYYDFDSTVSQTTSITPNSTPPYDWRLLLKRQKCQAMKIELYDTQVIPAEGMSLSALSLIVGIKQGLNKLPTSSTFD